MTPQEELKQTLEALGREVKQFREAHDQALKDKADGKAVGEIEAKLDKINEAITATQAARDEIQKKLDAAEARVKALEEYQAGFEKGADKPDALRSKHVDLFKGWLRSRSNTGEAAQALLAFERGEGKAVATTPGASGGYALPEIISRAINEQEQKLSPVRNLIKVVQAGSPDYKELVSDHVTHGGGWVGETDTRSETGTAGLRERAPTFGTEYAYPWATEESLNDLFFDVAAFLSEHTAITFAQLEGAAVISGNGTKKPTGLLNTAPVNTDDGASPERAHAALEFVPLAPGASPMGVITADGLINLAHAIRLGYRAGSAWTMNRLTSAVIRKLKDENGQYLWQPGLLAGTPDTLLGYPVAIWEDMPDVAANAHPVLFGNFRRAYVLVDLVGTRVTVDDNITKPGYVKWYIRRRLGGTVLDNYAVKAGKCVAA